MFSLLKEIKALKEEGRLHDGLLKRNRILIVIGTLLLAGTLFNVLFRTTSIAATAGSGLLFAVGFLFGYYLFSQMSAVAWDEDKEVVIAEKMDKVGYATLALYILFEVLLRTYLKNHFPTEAVPLILSAVSGTLLGRAIGTLAEIHRVYRHNH
jgi:hypothetical protein